jgi:hypothetical protein
LQAAVLWKAALQPISMKNIELHKNEIIEFTLKTSELKKKSKISKIFSKIVFQKGPADSY